MSGTTRGGWSDVVIIVEVKTSEVCGFTDNQPYEYLKWLDQRAGNGSKYFVLLVPPCFCNAHRAFYGMEKDRFAKDCPGSSIKYTETDWMELVRSIESSGLAETSIYVDDFCEMIRGWYDQKPISITFSELRVTSMFNKEAAQAACKIFSVVKRIAEKCTRAGYKIDNAFNRDWWNDGEYGFYVSNGSTQLLYVGIWTAAWLEHGIPVCVGVEKGWKKEIVENFLRLVPESELHQQSTTCNKWHYYIAAVPETYLTAEDAPGAIFDWIEEKHLSKGFNVSKLG